MTRVDEAGTAGGPGVAGQGAGAGTGAGASAGAGAGANVGDEAGTIAYSREMGLDHRDFFRILPKAMGATPYEVDGTTVRARIDGGTLRIELGAEQIRRIALLALPFAKVSFTFEGVPVERQLAFKRQFDLSFQRGGG